MSASRNSPRVAIVVTCFDEPTLAEMIASVKEDPSDVELLVVDDGSTDTRTVQLLTELEHEGIRVIRQVNQGTAAAAMAGVRASSAPYVMRFDADDLLEPGAVAVLADALDATPEAALAWGDLHPFGLSDVRVPSAPAFDAWLLTHTCCWPGSGSLVRRSALVEAGGWQLRKGPSDWDLWMSVAERGYDGVYVPCVIFRYRRDEGGQTNLWLVNAEQVYDELRRRHERLFAMRSENRRRSTAPLALKAAVSAVEALPFVSRLWKIWLCELFTHLFWNGGLRTTAKMSRQALALRLRRRQLSEVGAARGSRARRR